MVIRKWIAIFFTTHSEMQKKSEREIMLAKLRLLTFEQR